MDSFDPIRTMTTEGLVLSTSSRWHERLLVALAALLALALWWHGPVAQWADYHAFADRRVWLGISNAADVLSNLPFALVGLWGLLRLARPAGVIPARAAWQVFCIALIGTAIGSAFYHLAPDNLGLVVDRLPIAWACAALLCAFLAERLDTRCSSLPVLASAIAVGTVAVVHWWFTDQRGAGDLRMYLFVQFLPMLLVPASLLLRPAMPNDTTVTAASAWWVVLAFYAAAKGMELADRAVFDALGLVSGHTLKHLLAAVAAGWIVRAAVRSAQLR